MADFLFGPVHFSRHTVTPGPGRPVFLRAPTDGNSRPIARDELAAVWCGARTDITLFELIGRVRPIADDLGLPIAISSGERQFPLSVAGRAQRTDQFWMHCERASHETPELLRFRYLHELEYCPLHDVVLVVEVEGEDRLTTENIALCGELSAREDVVGLVWFGEPSPAAQVALEKLAQGVPWAQKVAVER